MRGVVIANNIRSRENVGSIFRTADALGFEEVILVGISPQPLDRFNRPDEKLAKAALGAQESVKWSYSPKVQEAITSLKERGYLIVGLEQGETSLDIFSDTKEIKERTAVKPIAIVLGAEVDGLSVEDRALCDLLIELPMSGTKESLNVAVAFGALGYYLEFLRTAARWLV